MHFEYSSNTLLICSWLPSVQHCIFSRPGYFFELKLRFYAKIVGLATVVPRSQLTTLALYNQPYSNGVQQANLLQRILLRI
jgi:hypothetical protein